MNFEKEPEVRHQPGRSRRRGVLALAVAIVVIAGLGVARWQSRETNPSVTAVSAQAGGEKEAVELAGRVDDLMEVAGEHNAAGRLEQAEEALTEAGELQREINGRFVGTPQASAQRLHEIEVERQTVLVTPMLAEGERLDAEAAGHLRRREIYQAQRIIAQAWEQIEAAAADAPLARGINEERRLRLDWLNRRHAELAWLQDLAYEALVPDPAAPGMARLETGPGWELHKRVMGEGAGSTAAETAEFCRRLGWVLGFPVRPAMEQGGPVRGAFQVVVEMGAGP